MTKACIASLGSINADFQVRVPRPLEAGTTLIATDFLPQGGGKAANVAFLARRLGAAATLIGRVGSDALGEQAMAPLRGQGIDLSHVSRAQEPTAVSMIAVPPGGKKGIVLANNANDCWDDAAVADAVAAIEALDPGSVLVADYEIPPALVERAVEAAGRRGVRVVIDPSPPERADAAVLARAHAIAPDAAEASVLSGVSVKDEDSAAAAAGGLAALGIPIVCIKLADGGCLLAHGGRSTLIPAEPVTAVDATGAGDAFTGALAVALLEGRDPLAAACFAVAASTCAVTGYGSQPAYPDRAGVEARMPWFAAGGRPRVRR
ncbi:ribokinase [Pigmentiphaga soli]|uniref:Ribokinase n=1 Tax=Pigmentiphaga soli TaxID=1007095 RepID=A0ABP8GVT8_9BURK